MQTDGPDPSHEDAPERLTWAPPRRVVAPPEGRPIPAPAPKHAAKARRVPSAAPPTLAAVPEPVAEAAPPVPAPVPAAPPPEPEPHLGRAFADAFDRLTDRLLERLRSLRQDVDADLVAVRSELAGLRQAVDAVGDRVQVRHIRTTLDEVNGEVIALRRAVLEWPELEQVALDITAIRGDLGFLFESGGGSRPGQAPSELLSELQHLVANLAGEVRRLAAAAPGSGADGPLLEEVASIRAELSALRRRPLGPAARLEDDQLDWLAAAVAERVADQLADQDDGSARWGRRR